MDKPIINKEIKSWLVPLTDEQISGLEADIKANGCRNALVVWKETGALLDGHHRMAICDKHDIKYDVLEISFKDREAARRWVIENQLNRRNLDPKTASLLRGDLYRSVKQEHGGDRKSSAQNAHLKTAEKIAKDQGVDPATVRRDAEYSEAVDKLGPPVRKAVMTHATTASKSDVKKAAALPPAERKEAAKAIAAGEKPEIKKPQPPVAMKDIYGTPIPPRFQPIFGEHSEKLKRLKLTIDEAMRQLKDVAELAGSAFLNVSDTETHLKNAKSNVKFAMPYCMYPASGNNAELAKIGYLTKHHAAGFPELKVK